MATRPEQHHADEPEDEDDPKEGAPRRDRPVGDFGGDGQSDEGGDSDTTG